MSSRGSVPRRAVSTNLNRYDSSLNTGVSSDYLSTYLIKLAILHYRTEPRFRVSENISAQMDSLTINLHTPSHSRKSSYAGLTSSGSSVSMSGLNSNSMPLDKIKSSKSVLPKNIIEIINRRLVSLFTTSNSPYTPDEISRRIFARFYTSLNGRVAETIKKSRSPFELLMFFLKEASKELQAYYSQTGEMGSTDPSVYAPQFIQFLIDSLTEKGYGSSHASLISELKSFKSASSRGETLRPSMNPNASPKPSNHGSHGSISGALGIDTSVQPSFKLSDMAIAKYVGALFGYSQDHVQQLIKAMTSEATDTAAVAELKFFKDELEVNSRHPSYTRTDFSSESAFREWKIYELQAMDQQINHFIKGKSSLATVLPFQPIPGESISFTYTPPDPKSFYRLLIQKCLRYDAQGASDALILSKDSSDLLSKVGNAWRLSSTTRALILLHVSSEFYEQGIFSLDKLTREVFELAIHQITDNGKEDFDPESWPECDKSISYFTMKSLYTAIVNQIIMLLEGIFNAKRPEIKSLMQFLGQTLIPFAEFKAYPELDPTPDQIVAIKDMVINVAEDKYQELVSEIPRDHTFSYEHVLHVADVVISRAKLLQKRYPNPLFGKVNIARLAISTNFKAFSEDCNLMVQHIIATMQAQDKDFSLNEITSLYDKLVETRQIYSQVFNSPFSFDIEGRFEPFALKEIQTSSDLTATWVDASISRDTFLPPEGADNSYISSSVGDAFTSFNEIVKIVNDLNWQNQVHIATFYTVMMKVSI